MSFDRDLCETERNLEGQPDEVLLAAAKRGDREARNTLYLRYRTPIGAMVGHAKRIVTLSSGTDLSMEPEDVVQQAFLIFCDLLDNWTPAHGPFIPYLSKLLPSHASHFVRDALHCRARVRVINRAKSGGDREQFDESLEEQVQSTLFWAEHIRTLKHPSRRWITLRYNYGLTSAQIADISGCSRRTIDRELNAAIAEMRDHLLSTWENCA